MTDFKDTQTGKDVYRLMDVTVYGRSLVICYFLWFFLGYFGVHRFYIGKVGTGLIMLILSIVGYVTALILIGYVFLAIVFIWWLYDAYYIYASRDRAPVADIATLSS